MVLSILFYAVLICVTLSANPNDSYNSVSANGLENSINVSGTITTQAPDSSKVLVTLFGPPIFPKNSDRIFDALNKGKGTYYLGNKGYYCGIITKITAKSLVLKIDEEEKTFVITSKTKITNSKKLVPISTFKTGDYATVHALYKNTNAIYVRKGPMLFNNDSIEPLELDTTKYRQ